jgi:hypothetical protein
MFLLHEKSHLFKHIELMMFKVDKKIYLCVLLLHEQAVVPDKCYLFMYTVSL